MALICTTVTTYITKEILDPVDKWVDEQQEKCHQYPWWDPRGWFCWIETITVKIVVWVIREIVVPFSKIVCTVMAGLAFLFLAIFAAAIDSVAPDWNVYTTLKAWLWTRTKITYEGKAPTNIKGVYLYSFTYHCSGGSDSPINITASNDDEAAQKAEEQCAKECSEQ